MQLNSMNTRHMEIKIPHALEDYGEKTILEKHNHTQLN